MELSRGGFPRLYEQQSPRKKCIVLWYSIEKTGEGFEMNYDEKNILMICPTEALDLLPPDEHLLLFLSVKTVFSDRAP